MSLYFQDGGTPDTLTFECYQFQTLPQMKCLLMNGTHQQEFLFQVNHGRSYRLLKKVTNKSDTLYHKGKLSYVMKPTLKIYFKMFLEEISRKSLASNISHESLVIPQSTFHKSWIKSDVRLDLTYIVTQWSKAVDISRCSVILSCASSRIPV